MKRQILYGPVVLVGVWYIVYAIRVIDPLFLPTPHAAIWSTFKILFTIPIWGDVASTLLRTLAGFLLAVLIGTPVGLFMGHYQKVYSSCELVVDFLRSLPALAIFPLLMCFFGIGDTAKVATTVFSSSLIVLVNAIYGVANSRRTRQVVASLMGATRSEIFWKVILMDALPQIFVGMRTALSLALVVVIVTEMFIGTNWGLGHRLIDAQLTYRVREMYAVLILVGLLGYGLNKGFIAIEKRVVHWSGQ